MRKKTLLVFGFALLLLGLSIGPSYATTTSTETIPLYPSGSAANLLALQNIKTTETCGIEVTESIGEIFRFLIMNSTEFDVFHNNPFYVPICILNISTNSYINNTFRFPADGDYVYYVKNEGSTTIYVTIKITRPGGIDGFTLLWVTLAVLASAVIIYSYRQKTKGNLAAKIPTFIT